MFELIKEIENANFEEIISILNAALSRYSVLFPDWEISTVSVSKSEDRNEQLDKMIKVLQGIKTIQE